MPERALTAAGPPGCLRVAFAGTPDFARVALAAIADAGHTVPLVLTQPDRPAGRGLQLQASPVKREALDRGLPVLQPRSLRLDGRWPDDAAAARDALSAARVEVLVVAAYGLILPAWTLQLPAHGCINIHASLLPRWRGAAPIQRAIEAGDSRTGITLMRMDEGLDTGPMLAARAIPIGTGETAGALLGRLATLGAEMVVEALPQLVAGQLAEQPQPADGVTYAAKIDKAEAAIDWSAPAALLERRVHAFNPAPGAHCRLAGAAVKVWRVRAVPGRGEAGTVLRADGDTLVVAAGEGALQLIELQRAGGRPVAAADFLRGQPLAVGQPLSSPA